MLKRAFGLLCVLAVGYLGVGLLVVYKMTGPGGRLPQNTPANAGLAYEDVTLASTDGVRLSGWWIPADDSRRAAVLVHGWGGEKGDEHILKTAPVYHREGYNVLVIDLRGQGESGGTRRTLAYREPRDVRGTLLWLQKRGFRAENIVLHGWSMGGATVVRAATGAGVAAGGAAAG